MNGETINIALRIVQFVLARVFLVGGCMMVIQPIEQLKKGMHWVAYYPERFVRLVGTVAILGALALVVPGLTHILPVLVPVAAIGFVLMMIGAVLVHLRLKEYAALAPPIILLLLFVFVVYGCLILLPLS